MIGILIYSMLCWTFMTTCGVMIFVSADKEDKTTKLMYLILIGFAPIVIPIGLTSALFDSN